MAIDDLAPFAAAQVLADLVGEDERRPTVQVTRGGLIDSINNNEQHRNVQLALKFIF